MQGRFLCPVCKHMLVSSVKQRRYETVLDHVENPNSVPPMRYYLECINPACKSEQVGIYWDFHGDCYLGNFREKIRIFGQSFNLNAIPEIKLEDIMPSAIIHTDTPWLEMADASQFRVMLASHDALFGIPDYINKVMAYTETGTCPLCGQTDCGQMGEHECPVCGLPMVWDDVPFDKLRIKPYDPVDFTYYDINAKALQPREIYPDGKDGIIGDEHIHAQHNVHGTYKKRFE
jgi:hypothetical protein